MVQQTKNTNPLLEQALDYYRRGLSVILIGADKKPPRGFKWKPYQTERPSEAQIRKWFGSGKYTSLAVVCGAVSGGLAVLDLDSEERCQWWRKEHSGLAETLPTAKTRKGLHIYFRAEPFRKQKGDELDLLCEGAYAILPPSPDKEWLIPLNGELPLIDPFSLGLEQFGINKQGLSLSGNQDFTEEREDCDDSEDIEAINKKSIASNSSVSSASSVNDSVIVFENLNVNVKNYVNTAIGSTLPGKEGYRNFLIFQFCRWLKGHIDFEKCSTGQLKPLVKMWYNRALPKIGTKVFDDTWADFCYGWPRVKYPKGDGMLKIAVQNAMNLQNSIAAEGLYEKPEVKLLVRICYELQKLQKNEPFWLAENDGAWIFGVTRPTIGKWFSMLEADKVVKKVEEHTNIKATRYKFIGN